jgi:hypothetical protein
MKKLVRHIIVVLVLLFSMSYPAYGQGNAIHVRLERCNVVGACRIPARECGVGPPPPGLVVPIDTNMGLLLVAGLGLGIYFLISAGKKEQLKAKFFRSLLFSHYFGQFFH